MGLDISHYKITEEEQIEYPPDLGVVEKVNFMGYDVESDFFNSFWKRIKIYKRISSSKFVTEESKLESTQKIWNEWNSNVKVNLISKEDLVGLSAYNNYRLQSENEIYFLKKEAKWYSLNLFEFTEIEGFYLKQIGYQRKGVTDNFFQYFNIQETGITKYTKREKFQLLFSLIGKYYDHDTDEDVKQLKIQFERDFLNEYEKGKSILSVSY